MLAHLKITSDTQGIEICDFFVLSVPPSLEINQYHPKAGSRNRDLPHFFLIGIA